MGKFMIFIGLVLCVYAGYALMVGAPLGSNLSFTTDVLSIGFFLFGLLLVLIGFFSSRPKIPR